MENKEVYDLIIIGGSAAATSAGIYAARRGLNFKIITKEFGGEVATSGEIGNWPGVNKTDGITLAGQFKEHLKYYGIEPEEGVEVEKVIIEPDGNFLIKSNNGNYAAKTIIVTTGVHPRELGVTGEKEFRNKGVSYCTVCDGPLFAGKVVATIGGGNSALESALMLTDVASKVYVINKNMQFKGDQILIENLNQKKNVEIIYNAKTAQIEGNEFVTGLKYKTEDSPQELEIKVDGIFIHIGMVPNSGLAPDGVKKDKFGQIGVNANCETSIQGLYAAGDVTDTPYKQIVIAAGMGATALLSAVNYLNRMK
ncbi:MAG: FAD-dependent oxidoreductase [Candidatus Yanofskybacteria bacterium]|nr:FAD-dependent oxidoreductase [Candidatus Yanofskybacteria bacterium]